MSEFFINRPIFATVISIVIVVAGAVSFFALPVSRNPEISPPTVQVTTNYPGANATTVAETVATPLEQEVNGVENMIYMSSTSASDGSYTLTVTFSLGTDMDMANVMVQNRVSTALPKLPEEVRRQGVTTRKQSTQILQFITLYAQESKTHRPKAHRPKVPGRPPSSPSKPSLRPLRRTPARVKIQRKELLPQALAVCS